MPNEASLSVVRSICLAIAETNKESFQETVGGKVVGSGVDHWAGQLYNAVNYQRAAMERKRRTEGGEDPNKTDATNDAGPAPAKTKRRRKIVGDGDPDDRDAVPVEFDEYGCVSWNKFAYPRGEDSFTQEYKRSWMVDHYHANRNGDPTKIEEFMEKKPHFVEDSHRREKEEIHPNAFDMVALLGSL